MTHWIVTDDATNREIDPALIGTIYRESELDLVPLGVHIQELDAVLPARAALERARAAWARTCDQLSLLGYDNVTVEVVEAHEEL